MGKAKEDTIFMGNFYLAGAELPKEHEELSKGKSNLGLVKGSYANQIMGLPQHQQNRPGMSGSGKEQTADIVDELGHTTKEGSDEGKVKEGSAEKGKVAAETEKAGKK